MYEQLCTNTPKEVMELADYSYRQAFEGRDEQAWRISYINSEVHCEYLKKRCIHHGMYGKIQFNTVVDHCQQLPSGKFEVNVRNTGLNCTERRIFDKVAVCTGHYSIPDMPTEKQYPGIDNVRKAKLIHSRDIKDCRNLKDRTVFMLGSGFSAEDIGQMAVKFGAKHVYMSSLDPWFMHKGWPENVTFHPCLREIKHVESDDGMSFTEEIHLVDGTVIRDVDDIIFSTGYQCRFPFMHGDIAMNDMQRHFLNYQLYKTVLMPGNPNLAYIGMQKNIIFNLPDVQARMVAQHFTGQLQAPSLEDQLKEVELRKKQVLGYNYGNML